MNKYKELLFNFWKEYERAENIDFIENENDEKKEEVMEKYSAKLAEQENHLILRKKEALIKQANFCGEVCTRRLAEQKKEIEKEGLMAISKRAGQEFYEEWKKEKETIIEKWRKHYSEHGHDETEAFLTQALAEQKKEMVEKIEKINFYELRR